MCRLLLDPDDYRGWNEDDSADGFVRLRSGLAAVTTKNSSGGNTAFDGAPALSFDGTTLYFFSERAGGFGKRDLYVTTRTRLSGDAAAAQGSPAGTWTLVAPMPTARLGLAATTGMHAIIYAICCCTGP